jgi:hypothetical protein
LNKLGDISTYNIGRYFGRDRKSDLHSQAMRVCVYYMGVMIIIIIIILGPNDNDDDVYDAWGNTYNIEVHYTS